MTRFIHKLHTVCFTYYNYKYNIETRYRVREVESKAKKQKKQTKMATVQEKDF